MILCASECRARRGLCHQYLAVVGSGFAGESHAAFKKKENLDGKQSFVLSVEKEEEVTEGYSENMFCIIISFSVAGFTEASDCQCSSLFQSITVGAVHAVISRYFSFTVRAQLLSVPGYGLVRTFIYINQFREVSHR